jgi:hypothetical protein
MIPYATLSISLPHGLIKRLPCAQLPGLGGIGPRVWYLGKLISTTMAEVSIVKLKAKVQGSSGAVLFSANSEEGAHPML